MTTRSATLLLVASVALWATPAQVLGQELSINFGDDGSLAGRSIELIALITILSLAPGIAMMVTCFPFIITVLAILRQAIGIPQSPPNMLLVTLALFMTYFIMEPVFQDAWQNGVAPIRDNTLSIEQGFQRAVAPFQSFMAGRVDGETLAALAELRGLPPGAPANQPPLSILVPSFILSEIARAFEIGFLIFLPFLIIDLVVAAVLMSMGMMMVPPAVVALPFKLAFFVVADGWSLIASALMRSYQ